MDFHIPSPLHFVHNFHGKGFERHSCEINKDLLEESKKIKLDLFEKINNKTLPIHLKFDPQFYNGDIYIDLSKP